VAEQFISQFGRILDSAETSVLPMEAAQLKALVTAVLSGRSKSTGGAK
jgi:hypothetical protein